MNLSEYLLAAFAFEKARRILNSFNDNIKKRDDEFEIKRYIKYGETIAYKFHSEKEAIAVLKRDSMYAVDLKAEDPNFKLVKIDEEQYKELIDICQKLERDYASYNVVGVVNLDDSGSLEVVQADEEQDNRMLDICIKVLDTLDGKEKHFKDLKRESFGRLMLILDGDDIMASLIYNEDKIYGSLEKPMPLFFSQATSEAMKLTYEALKNTLPNNMSNDLKSVLSIAGNLFNNLPPEKQQELLEEIKRRRGC